MPQRSVHSESTNEKQTVKRAHTTPHYAEAVKRQAVTLMLTSNPDHPLSNASIDAARQFLGFSVNTGTLHDWLQTYGNEVKALIPQQPTNAEVIQSTYNQVREKWTKVRDLHLDHLADPAVIATSSVMASNAAAGTAQDKLDKMLGLSPSILSKVQLILKALDVGAWDVESALDDYYHHVMESNARKGTIISITAQHDTGDVVIAEDSDNPGRQAIPDDPVD